MRLKGKTAIVTGGAKGIGEAIAKLFAREGATVIACDVIELQYTESGVEFYNLNVTDVEGCKKFAEYAINKYKKIDILVNNAGIVRDAMTRKMTDEQWNLVIDVNLKGPLNLTRYIGPHMEDSGGGSIINLSSIASEGNIGQANYSSTKAGIIGLAKAWAKEFARKHVPVRCNVIAPGFIMTDILKTVPEHLIKKGAEEIPLGRPGAPIDIAYAALYFASDESSFVTGQVLTVSGGLKM
jgi:3-oxoacyl-[acyl-carrier protein] reductase